MPLIHSSFSAKFPFTSKHFSTMYRTVFTRPTAQFIRRRIATPDGDFLDLDFSSCHSKNAVLMIHGLEGSSDSKYVLATTSFLSSNNYDIIVINLRGCSGELNKKFKAYHTGETGDLHFVLDFLTQNYDYATISLLGFSLGGNVVLKYAGEQKENLNPLVDKIISISPPCDLKGASMVLSKKSNIIYMKRFLKTLVSKALQKAAMFPEQNLNTEKLVKAANFTDFDSLFTAPSFGFKDEEDYWEKASCKPFLKDIQVKSYLLTAKNDPFLSESCFPIDLAKKSNYLHLELTEKGGHIGFVKSIAKRNDQWFEKKILNYLKD